MKKIYIIVQCTAILLLLTACSDSQNSSVSDTKIENSVEALLENNEQIQINISSKAENPLINLKSPISGKVCYSSETSTLFYSDSNGLYQKNGNDIRKLSSNSAMAINLYEGKLYYISHGEIQRFPIGKVYCVDLSDGSEKCLIDEENISNISVCDDTIYYIRQSVSELDGGAISISKKYMKCDLSGENRTENHERVFNINNGIYASDGKNVIEIHDLETNKLLFSDDKYDRADNICFNDENVYFIGFDFSNYTNSLGEIQCSHNDFTVKYFSEIKEYIEDYTIYNDSLYALCGEFLYNVTDNFQRYETPSVYLSVYSGDRLYALKQNGSLCALELIEEDGVNKIAETDIN